MPLLRPLGVLGALSATALLLHCNRETPEPTVTNRGASPSASATADVPDLPASSFARAPTQHVAPDPFTIQASAHERKVMALVAAFNAHDAKGIAALYDQGCLVFGPTPGGFAPETGREPLVVGHEALFTSQPDVKSATVRLLLVGDRAVQEWVTTGTATATGKVVGFQAGSVYRFGGDGKIQRDSTYYDLLTPAVQTGSKKGEVRPVPALPEAPVVVVAGEGTRDARAVQVLKKLHAALRDGHKDEVAKLFTEDAVEVSLLAVKDAVGRAAVVKELLNVTAQLPRVEVTGAWGDDKVAAGEIIFSSPQRESKDGKDGRPEVQIHALHVVDVVDGRIAHSTLYASRRELEDE